MNPRSTPTARRHGLRRALTACALAHGLVLFLAAGCDDQAPAEAPVQAAAGRQSAYSGPPWSAEQVEAGLAELAEAYTPVPLTETSDVQERLLGRRRECVARLHAGPPELGAAALARFRATPADAEDLRVALLDVAARTDPVGSAPALAELVRHYGPDYSLRVRANAARFLAVAAPQDALALLEPLIREPRQTTTYPPQEVMLDAWIAAARKLERLDADLLADVATNVRQPPDARYRAIEELGRVGTPRGRAALENVLVESGSDGYLRRKAAQAVVASLPQADACAVLMRVADRETDQAFLLFLADMVEKNCP